MRIIISNYNFYHTPFQVEAMSQYAEKMDIMYYSAVSPLRLNQVCDSFPKHRIRNYFWRYAWGRTMDKYILKNSHFSKSYEEDYSRLIGRTLYKEKGRYIFHSFNGCALYGVEQARKSGSLSVVESGVHPKFYKSIQKEEYAKYGLEIEGISDKYVNTTEEELSRCDYILTISDICRKTFISEGIELKKINQIPISVDTSLFYRTKARNKRFIVLYVGRITVMKGVQYLFDAYDLLKRNGYNLELRLAGTITDDVMKSYFSKYTDDNSVNFLGQCSIERLRDEYSEASVMVMPSLVDSFCMSIYESFSCKTPVISTENVGAPIKDFEDGFIVPIRSSDSLAEKIAYFHDNREQIEIFGNKAFDSIKNYSWKDYAEKLAEFYKRIY